MLVEPARVLRYPRLQAKRNLAESEIYEYIQCLRQAAELVAPDHRSPCRSATQPTAMWSRPPSPAQPISSAPYAAIV